MIILLTIIFLVLFLWTMDKCYNDNLTAFYGIAFWSWINTYFGAELEDY